MKADLLERLAFAWAGISPLYKPPDWWGDPGPGLVALTGAPRQLPWQAVASATAPGLAGAEHRFAVGESGEIVSGDNVSRAALAPLVDAVDRELDRPYCAIAVRDKDNVWAVAANTAELVELPRTPGKTIEVSRIGGRSTARVDEAPSRARFPDLEALFHGDGVVVAHRLAKSKWIAEVFPM